MDQRLDARCYHLKPIRKKTVKASFVGTPEAVTDDGVTYSEASSIQVSFGESETITFSIGDHVFLTGDRKGSGCEIGSVLKFWEQIDPKPTGDDKGIWFSCKWFWRPEHIDLPDNLEPAWDVRAGHAHRHARILT